MDRPTKRADEITKEEYAEGRELLKEKLRKYRPKVACYCGMGVYKELTQSKKVHLGQQEVNVVGGIIDYVCSSSSGLNSKPIGEQIGCFMGLKNLIEKIDW